MQTKTTFYDLLEVSANASQEAIRVSFERLKASYLDDRLDSKGLEPGAHFQLIKDAYFTLSDATRREAYDQKIFGRRAASPVAVVQDEPLADGGGIPAVLKWGLVLLLLAGGVFYYKTTRDIERAIQLEQARLVAEQKAAELAAAERLKEVEEARSRRESERQAEREAMQRQRELEQAQREADKVSARLESARLDQKRAEERQKYEFERREQREESRRQREAEEARRRLEREKAIVRQMEQENRSTPARVSTISSPHSSVPSYKDTRNSER